MEIPLLQWRREVAFAGFEVPIQMDVSANKMIFGVSGIDPQRRDELIKVRSNLFFRKKSSKSVAYVVCLSKDVHMCY